MPTVPFTITPLAITGIIEFDWFFSIVILFSVVALVYHQLSSMLKKS